MSVLFFFFPFLALQSFLLALQQNSITLIPPYNHFSSPRPDSFPRLTEKKKPNYSLTLALVLCLTLLIHGQSLSSSPLFCNTCSSPGHGDDSVAIFVARARAQPPLPPHICAHVMTQDSQQRQRLILLCRRVFSSAVGTWWRQLWQLWLLLIQVFFKNWVSFILLNSRGR